MGQDNSGSSAIPFGPSNPHPLSKMKTELVWEGKYDEYGNRREIDMAGLAMPMQRIETIDQPRSEAAAANQLDLFNKKTRRLDDFRNRLIWGDNKLVMASLLQEFRGKIDLIYIDPHFDVGADYHIHHIYPPTQIPSSSLKADADWPDQKVPLNRRYYLGP